jgi:hypothetical protein
MEAPKFQPQSIYKISQDFNYKGDDYWGWSVWIEAKEEEQLDKIEYVVYVLHPTFKPPIQRLTTGQVISGLLPVAGAHLLYMPNSK